MKGIHTYTDEVTDDMLVEVHHGSTVDKVDETVHTVDTIAESVGHDDTEAVAHNDAANVSHNDAENVSHNDAEAVALVSNNTGELVGMVVGGILSAVAITCLVGFHMLRYFEKFSCLRSCLSSTKSSILRRLSL